MSPPRLSVVLAYCEAYRRAIRIGYSQADAREYAEQAARRADQ